MQAYFPENKIKMVPQRVTFFAVVGRAFLPDHGYRSQSDCLDRQECPSYYFFVGPIKQGGKK